MAISRQKKVGIILYIALNVSAISVAADQLPSLSNVVSGGAEINSTGSNLTITQSSDQAILDWNSFNIGSNASVRFNQPSAQSLTINNILSTQPAKIDGTLSANGRLFFSSPNGMIFGKDAKVNVETLLATTHRISSKTANTFELNNSGNGSIINLGQLAANNVYLIGRDVLNAGDINSANGSVGLLAASDLRVAFDDAGLLTATVLSNDLVGTVENIGNITADKIQLKGSASEAAVASTIKNDVTRADTLISENGVFKLVKNKGTLKAKTVELDAGQNGGVEVGGVVATDNLSGKGGLITITGKEVTLTSGARISANGSSGGGDIQIGGDWQGTGALLQSTFATVEAGATVMANATDGGNGGKIVIWSDISNPNSITKVGGVLSAAGGPNGGDGGQIETSGKVLDIANIQVSTVGENIGLWLLDPTNVTIDNAYATNLSNALNTTNVTVQADNDIYFGFNNGITKSSGVETTLTLDAGNDIDSNLTGTQHTINGAAGSPLSVTLKAGNLIDLRRIKIDAKGGDVIFSSNTIQAANETGGQWAVFADQLQVDSDFLLLNATGMSGSTAGATSGLFYATSDMVLNINDTLALMYSATLRADGNLTISSPSTHVSLMNQSKIESVNGDLSITAAKIKQGNNLKNTAPYAVIGGAGTNNSITALAGSLTLNVDDYQNTPFNAGATDGKIFITANDHFSVASYSNSFVSDFSWNNYKNSNPILDFSSLSASSITIGKQTNTARVSIDAPISTAGAVSVTGGIIDGSSNITTTDAASGSITINSATYSYSGNLSVGAGSTISLNYGGSNQTVDFSKLSGMGTLVLTSSGSITQSSALSVDKLALKGTGSYTLSNSGNSVNTLAAGNDDGSGIGALTFVNSGALSIGTVNPNGIKSNGATSVSTLNGDLSINQDVLGQSVTLAAGKNAPSGSALGGNLKINGNPNIVASNGSLVLYTGDIIQSPELIPYVGSLENISSSATSADIALQQGGTKILSRVSSSIDFQAAQTNTENAQNTLGSNTQKTDTSQQNAEADPTLTLNSNALVTTKQQSSRNVILQVSKNTSSDLNKEAGAGGSDENDNAISGTLGNQGNDKDVGNAGGSQQGVAEGVPTNSQLSNREAKANLNRLYKTQSDLKDLDADALGQLFSKYEELNLRVRNGFWTPEITLPNNVPLGSKLNLERRSTWETVVKFGNDEITPARGEKIAIVYEESGWILEDEATEISELNNGDKEAGAGGSDENDNEISGTLGNQGNDKDVGNAGGDRGNKSPADEATSEEVQPIELALLEEEVAEVNNGDKEAGAGGSDENDNEISGTLGNQGNDKDVGNAGGDRGNKPPAEDPPAEDPPAEDPPAEDPPAEDPPAEDPPAEDPPAEDPPAEDPPAEDPPAEDPPAEDPPAEDPPAEDPPAEDPPAEDPPAEDPPAEDPPAEDPPAEDPPAEDPPAEDPPAEDPAVEEDIQVITPVIVLNDDNFEGEDERNIIARELEAVELYSDTFIYQVSDDVFKHTDPAAEITVSVEMVDGSPLPAWILYDVQDKRIIGKLPNRDPIVLEIKLIGRDQYGDSAETVVRIQQGAGQ